MKIKTSPLKVGAPLDIDVYTDVMSAIPTQDEIRDELARAQVELMHAIARHRKAWANLRALSDKLDSRGTWKDSDLTYQKAVSDVKWWREEMSTQAVTVSALAATRRPGEVTASFHVKRPSFRETVEGWNGFERPTTEQVATARAWMQSSGGNPAGPPDLIAKVRTLAGWPGSRPRPTPPKEGA